MFSIVERPSAKIRSQNLCRWSIRENWIPRKFPGVRYDSIIFVYRGVHTRLDTVQHWQWEVTQKWTAELLKNQNNGTQGMSEHFTQSDNSTLLSYVVVCLVWRTEKISAIKVFLPCWRQDQRFLPEPLVHVWIKVWLVLCLFPLSSLPLLLSLN